MFLNHIKIALRQFNRNKVYTLVNVLGLSFALFSSLLIFKYVKFERSYDQEHVDSQHTYRLYRHASGDWGSEDIASIFPGIPVAIKNEMPEITAATRVIGVDKIFQSFAMTYVPKNGDSRTFNVPNTYFVDDDALKIFGLEWESQAGAVSLDNPNEVVISKSLADKLFRDEEPVGKFLLFKNMKKNLLVTGVFKDLPDNVHFHYDMLFSISSLPREWELDTNFGWGNFYTYIRFDGPVDMELMEAKTNAIVEDKETWYKEENIVFKYQPISDIHLESYMTYELEANGNGETLYLLQLIGVLILIVAWFNYINLSTTKMLDRTKEAGIRKAIGGFSRQLIEQMSAEVLLLNLTAVAVAITLLQAFQPQINSLLGVHIDYLSLGELGHTMLFFGGFIFISLCIGIYPARLFAFVSTVDGIQGKRSSGKKSLFLRRVLTTVQFVIAIVMLVSTYTVYKQLNFLQDQSLGMNIDQVMIIKKPFLDSIDRATGQQAFINSVNQMPSVSSISAASEIPGYEISYMRWVAKGPYENSKALYAKDISADAFYDDVFELEMAYGRWYEEGMPSNSLVLNESAFKKLYGDDDPLDWINQTTFYETVPYRLIGIVKDYKQQSFKYNTEPHIYTFSDRIKYFNVRVQVSHIQSTMSDINQYYNQYFPDSHFEYFFMDEYFNKQYSSDRLFGTIFAFFSAFAVVVVALGLFGLSLYTLNRRSKEVSIRKVLGAGFERICILLTKEYILLLILAALVAVPVAYLFSVQWLNNFLERVPLGVMHYTFPVIVLGLITLATIAYQLVKLAQSNPVEHLKQDS